MELNKIYNEDNISLISRMPNGLIDLTVTSPPYDNLRDYKGYTFDFETLAKELYRVTKPGGVVVWVVGDATINGSETGTSFRQAIHFMNVGFNLHDTMIFEKNNPVPQFKTKRYTNAFEYMFIFTKGKPNTCNYLMVKTKDAGQIKSRNGGSEFSKQSVDRPRDESTIVKEKKIKTNIWGYTVGGTISNEYTKKHPAIFPEQLAEDHILSWSNPGDLVFDPFIGSGTTAIAALDTERQFIGAEIAKEYVDIANERIKNHTTQTDIFDVLEGN